MISELKIELNDRIISNESNVNHSHIINHLLENNKNDDLIYRNMDIHTDVVKYNDTNKDVFLTKNGDTMRVVCNVYLKDISNFFKNLHIPLKLAEFNITFKLIKLRDMSQLPTSPFPKRGTSGPGNVFSTLC